MVLVVFATDKNCLETTFAVPLHCEDCVKDVSGALGKLEGRQWIVPKRLLVRVRGLQLTSRYLGDRHSQDRG